MSLSREQMLVEMGISPLWVLRDTADADLYDDTQNGATVANGGLAASEPRSDGKTAAAMPPLAERQPEIAPPANPPVMTALHNEIASQVTVATSVPSGPISNLSWPELARAVADC